MEQSNEKLKALTIGGNLPALGKFEHHIVIPAIIPTAEATAAYQGKRFRKVCPLFKTAREAQEFADAHNAGIK